MGTPGPGMTIGAKVRLMDLLNREIFIGMRRVFGYGGGIGPMVQDISPEAIVIGGHEKSAEGIRATFRQILHGAVPARTIVIGTKVLPFVTEPDPAWPPILHTARGTGLRRLEIPRAAYLWSLAESEAWADEVPRAGSEVIWEPLPLEAPTDHPHDRILAALNREALPAQARLQKETSGRTPVGLTVTDIDPYLITVEFVPSSDFMSCWNADPAAELARDLHLIGSPSWIRLYVRDSACGWIGIDERLRARPGDVPKFDRYAPPDPRQQEFWRLQQECERIGWERGGLARATPVHG